MVCPDIDSEQDPAALLAGLSDRSLDRASSSGVQSDRSAPEPGRTDLTPVLVGRIFRVSVNVVVAVDRTSLITVKPCAVSSKRDEISDRRVGVVPHRAEIVQEKCPTRYRGWYRPKSPRISDPENHPVTQKTRATPPS